jgi:hypothetical protein
MAGLDQRGSAGAGLHHPRVPQPLIETLALQATPIREQTGRAILSSITQQTKSFIREKRGLLCAIAVIRLWSMR